MFATLKAYGLLYAVCASTLFSLGLASFDVTSKNNVAVYYGQGSNQQSLSTYCADSSIDVIILSFVYLFPQQANGYPGINFGNQCSGETYPGPGYAGNNVPASNQLLKCPNLQRDLNTCRKSSPGKKILLSLGGANGGYQLTGAADGVDFATKLWYIFGPRQQAMVDSGYPRPFDYNNEAFSVDGFDLDIEHPPTDGAEGYKAMVIELRKLYGAASGQFYLTASPQCQVPDNNMKEMLSVGSFDMIFIQFYNTPFCSARQWVSTNPNYKVGDAVATGGFTYDAWTTWMATTPSKNARLYIGLPGSANAANSGFDLTVPEASNLINAYYCSANFGGIAIWEATYASSNVVNGKNFYQNMKSVLTTAAAGAGRCSHGSQLRDKPRYQFQDYFNDYFKDNLQHKQGDQYKDKFRDEQGDDKQGDELRNNAGDELKNKFWHKHEGELFSASNVD
ncbi:hypothetical protein JX265_007415 [Neoarthrinium moseri]|uniref:chitinase n=1 Tax=Neoarthrinium moseri TaxID=1658444 RepID=A0A9P9WK84_9PEZI|nr:hypothetical protein JX265_007415 [Neoarthrinium moseri]